MHFMIQQIRKDRSRLIKNATIRVNRVKASKEKVTLSIKKIQEEHLMSAREVRSSSLEIDESLRKSRQLEIDQKREIVDKMHKTLELSRINLNHRK